MIHLRKRRHVVRFSGVADRPAVSLNRGFSAPLTLSVEQKTQDQYFLARYDGDLFSRWQAFNTLLTETLIAACRKLTGGRGADYPAELVALAGTIAADGTLEHAYRALALTQPGEADIAREIGGNINPDAIFSAREGLVQAIAEGNRTEFAALYNDLSDGGPFSPDAASAGRRSLRNVLLDHLSVLDGGAALAERHYATATNMTDRAAALAVLAHRHPGTDEAREALAAFEQAYADDALVMDKWFTIQASAPGADAIGTVRRLMRHKGFSMSNPNRVRSLLGTFFSANQTGFHRADGAGYVLFAETVLEVGRGNPQVAARLATGLRSWRSLEPGRQDKAREALVTIAASPNLSADVRDIVERTLA